MIKNKKLALLSVAGLLGALAIGVTTASSTGIIRTNGDDATVWKHYAAVEATFTSHGSKEFWASCTAGLDGKYGTRVFTAPTGTIEEGGDIKNTAFWNDIVEGDDRYVAPLDSTITFDARGGVAVTEGKYSYGTEASALPTTTRAADDYYESYDFGGWYKDGVAYDKVAGSATVKAKWKYGDAKRIYVNNWGHDDFTKDDTVTWKTVAEVNALIKASLPDFTRTDDDGVAFVGSTSNKGVTTPKINFSSLLDDHPAIYMEVGGYNSYNEMNFAVSDTATKRLFKNDTPAQDDTTNLEGIKLRFTKDSSGNVHMHFVTSNFSNPMNYDGRTYRSGDITLSDDQANGTSGLTFTMVLAGSTRVYWVGRPYYVSGENDYIKVTKKTRFSVTGAALRTKTEHTSGAGAAFWYEPVGGFDENIGILCNDVNVKSVLTFDNIDFDSLFEQGVGIKFTIGAWNGTEAIYFNNVKLGVNAVKPEATTDSSGKTIGACDNYTQDDINKTFRNWDITIDDIGLHAYNKNEAKTYDVPLTAGQIAGTEGIGLKLADTSNGRFFLLSDVHSYHF